MRFNHMELTLPKGELNEQTMADLSAFYGDVFGWDGREVEVVGKNLYLDVGDEQFILVAESRKPMQSPGHDHLGLLMASREEVDEKLALCQAWQGKDERVEVRTYDDLHTGNVVVHAFYVKYILPIYFDVQVIERS